MQHHSVEFGLLGVDVGTLGLLGHTADLVFRKCDWNGYIRPWHDFL